MNVGPSERVDILGWLSRFELDVVAFSCKFFRDLILANQGVLPLRETETVAVSRKIGRLLQKEHTYVIVITTKQGRIK